jgi:hypothetical protein
MPATSGSPCTSCDPVQPLLVSNSFRPLAERCGDFRSRPERSLCPWVLGVLYTWAWENNDLQNRLHMFTSPAVATHLPRGSPRDEGPLKPQPGQHPFRILQAFPSPPLLLLTGPAVPGAFTPRYFCSWLASCAFCVGSHASQAFSPVSSPLGLAVAVRGKHWPPRASHRRDLSFS